MIPDKPIDPALALLRALKRLKLIEGVVKPQGGALYRAMALMRSDAERAAQRWLEARGQRARAKPNPFGDEG